MRPRVLLLYTYIYARIQDGHGKSSAGGTRRRLLLRLFTVRHPGARCCAVRGTYARGRRYRAP